MMVCKFAELFDQTGKEGKSTRTLSREIDYLFWGETEEMGCAKTSYLITLSLGHRSLFVYTYKHLLQDSST